MNSCKSGNSGVASRVLQFDSPARSGASGGHVEKNISYPIPDEPTAAGEFPPSFTQSGKSGLSAI